MTWPFLPPDVMRRRGGTTRLPLAGREKGTPLVMYVRFRRNIFQDDNESAGETKTSGVTAAQFEPDRKGCRRRRAAVELQLESFGV